MDRYTKIAGRFLRHGLVAGMLMFAALPAHAASVSFFLDQSNKLPDGANYLSVMLTENATGGVDFLVKTLAPLNDIAGSHFGIQKFGFSFVDGTWGEISGLPDRMHGKSNRHGDDFGKHETWDEISGLPDHWRVQNNKRMDGFGNFDIRLQGKGKVRTDTLSFTVNGVSLGDFDSLFAAHVAGFEWCKTDDEERNKKRQWCGNRDCVTSAYFAGSMPASPVPVPAAAWLFGSGLAGLLGLTSRRKRKTTTEGGMIMSKSPYSLLKKFTLIAIAPTAVVALFLAAQGVTYIASTYASTGNGSMYSSAISGGKAHNQANLTEIEESANAE